jgi:glycosyltransferase involved in cell wall biosynthesis
LKIALVHNAYGRPSGEEVVIENLVRNLESHGHAVSRFERCSAEIDGMRCGQMRAFFSGIYSAASRHAFGQFIKDHAPDVLHVHNVFPLISPSVLLEARRRDIPVVMTLHNFRLICPNGLLMRNGKVCHDCLGGREHWCLLRNCEHDPAKSLGYALRTAIARRRRWFLDNVSHFLCLTRFQRDLHVSQGFPRERCSVIPNAVPTEFLQVAVNYGAPPLTRPIGHPSDKPSEPFSSSSSKWDYKSEDEDEQTGFVGYVGRLSPEKDMLTLLQVARRLPQVPFKIAGSLARMPELPRQAPANVEFLGQLERGALQTFYSGMRLFVFTTRCYEGLPTTLLEAMALRLPVVCTKIGGLPELVEDGETGFLTAPGNPVELASRISLLWEDQELATRMGQAGRAKVMSEYHPDAIYARHLEVYHRAQRGAAEVLESLQPTPHPCPLPSGGDREKAHTRGH